MPQESNQLDGVGQTGRQLWQRILDTCMVDVTGARTRTPSILVCGGREGRAVFRCIVSDGGADSRSEVGSFKSSIPAVAALLWTMEVTCRGL
jgi:hypothetical protein